MQQSVKDKFVLVDSLLARKQFEEVDGLLGQIDVSILNNENLHIFNIQLSELFLHTGHSDKIDGRLLSAIEYFRKSSSHEHFARAKYLHGWHLQQIGELHVAQEVLTEAYLTYLRFDALRAAARTLNRLASVQFQLGSIYDAVRNLDKCAEIYDQLGDINKNLIVKRNAALMLFRNGTLNKAIEAYHSLEKNIASISNNYDKCHYYLAYGMTSGLKGDTSKAYHLFELFRKILITASRDHVNFLEYQGWLHLLEGKLPEAEQNLTEAVNMGLQIAPESDLVSQTKRLLADVYIAQGRFPEAEQTAREALTVAQKIGERAEIAGSHRVLAQSAYHAGHADAAKEQYFKALDIYQTINYRYEMAVTRYLAATSSLYDKTESAAMLYLAREYFRSEEIPGWSARVEQALAIFQSHPIADRITADRKSKIVFIAAHPLTRKALETAATIAPTDMTMLLTGPTGSGKDRLAEYIHHISGRTGKFVSINCAAIPDSMIEAELFGHCRGAFTGAGAERIGLFEEAHGGTLYLNEIVDASPEFQVKLLQAIENKKVRRIGSNESRPVDIRIIAATNQDLKELISARKFRPDLYYRLNEVVIALPALADRIEDIPALTVYFLKDLGLESLNGDNSLNQICQYLSDRPWLGNVRELKGELKKLWNVAGGDISKIRDILEQDAATNEEKLRKILKECGGNKSAAARELGVSETTIRNRIKRYNLAEQIS